MPMVMSGAFALSPVLLASRDQKIWQPIKLNDLRLQSHRKKGDCKQSTLRGTHRIIYYVSLFVE